MSDDYFEERCPRCGARVGDHIVTASAGPLQCPPRKPYAEACEDIRDLDEGTPTRSDAR